MHSSLEDSLDTTCPNCGCSHDADFFSDFEHHMHYIRGRCKGCGYELHIHKDVFGAGIFGPDGKQVGETILFRSKHVDHMRAKLEENGTTRFVVASHRNTTMRIIDPGTQRECPPARKET